MTSALNLEQITGLEQPHENIIPAQEREVSLQHRLIKDAPNGRVLFYNSGARTLEKPKTGTLDSVKMGVEDVSKVLGWVLGERFTPTVLSLPANYLEDGPHFHPGGEWAYVMEGEYFDADKQGNPIATYPAGTMVFYGAYSTHRPLSKTGATIVYQAMDGIVFARTKDELLTKITRFNIPIFAETFARESTFHTSREPPE